MNQPATAPVFYKDRSEFTVGDIVRDTGTAQWGDAIITELTEKGFKFVLLEPHSMGPRHGTIHAGEAYEAEHSPLIQRYSVVRSVRANLPDTKIVDFVETHANICVLGPCTDDPLWEIGRYNDAPSKSSYGTTFREAMLKAMRETLG